MASIRSTNTRVIKPSTVSTVNIRPAALDTINYAVNVTTVYTDDAILGVETWGSFIYGYREPTPTNTSLGQKMPQISTKEL